MLITTVLIAGLVFLTAFSYAQEEGNSKIRTVHLSPGLQEVDVFIDGEREIEGLEFGQVTSYIDSGSGTNEIVIVSADEDIEDEEVSAEVELEEDRAYTVAISNQAINPDLELIEDRKSSRSNDRPRVRIAHFSPDLLEVDVTLENNQRLELEDVSYTQVSDYQQFEPDDYTLFVEDSERGNEIISQGLTLQRERDYTFFVAGSRRGQGIRVVPVADTSRRPVKDSGNGDGVSRDGDWNVISEGNFIVECRVVEG